MITSGRSQAQRVGCTWQEKMLVNKYLPATGGGDSARLSISSCLNILKLPITSTEDSKEWNRNTWVLRQSWQCQFALQNSRELRQQCKELHNSIAGAEKPVCSELFSLQLFPNSFFLTANFHTFVMSPRANFSEKSQHN